MRGMLRITSARTPYLRAGLSWPTREAVEIDIRDLDAGRLTELLNDPVLSIGVGQDDGTFAPVDRDWDIHATLDVVEAVLSGAGRALGPKTPVASIDDTLADLQSKLDARHIDDIEQLLAAYDTCVARSQDQAGQIMSLTDKIGWLQGELDTAQISQNALLDQNSRLVGELEAAKAAAHLAKPKPSSKAKAPAAD